MLVSRLTRNPRARSTPWLRRANRRRPVPPGKHNCIVTSYSSLQIPTVRPVFEYSTLESVSIDMQVRSYLLAVVATASAFAFLATPAQAGGCRHRHHHYSCYQRDWSNCGYYQNYQPQPYYQQQYYPSAQCYRQAYYYPASVFQFEFCR
jgi:hypothetical protein